MIAAIFSACSGSDSTPADGGAIIAGNGTPQPTEVGPSLPFAAAAAKLAEVTTATDQKAAPLIEACMNAAGFAYSSPPQAPQPDYLNLSRRYGISNLEEASVYGYGLSSATSMPAPAQLSEAEAKALYGDPATAQETPVTDPDGEVIGGFVITDGCFDAGLTASFGGLIPRQQYLEATKLFEAYAGASFARLTTSREWLNLTKDWSRCMDETGYAGLANPLDVPAELSEGVPDVRKAVADVTCKQNLDFIDRAIRIEDSIQTGLIDGDGGSVFELIDSLQTPD